MSSQNLASLRGEEGHMSAGGELDRRSFLVGAAAAGGGLALGFTIPSGTTPLQAAAAPAEINCWVVIAPDDTVTIRTARAEMGQGVMTALAMLVAEELECDWAKVGTAFVAPADNLRRGRAWGDMSTGASQSVAQSQIYLRRAGAAAREMLIAAAALRWGVPTAECTAHNSLITHAASGRTLTFGAVASDAAKIEPPAHVELKDPRDWTLVGTARQRLDVPDKVTGAALYATDVRLPDMLYAAVVHCPVFGGRLKSVDDSALATMKGVRRIVRLPDAVAVVAESWWQAKRAADALHVVWDDCGHGTISTADIAAAVREALYAAKANVGRADGDPGAALAGAVRRIEAEYAVPFLAHATMEPQTCTVHVKADGVDVWAPSQDAMTTLVIAADAAGVANHKVAVHPLMLGGGFGRRNAVQEFVREAVLIAKEFDQPVKMLWTREEDTAHDLYRPFGMAHLVAGLDADGMPAALTIRLAGPSFVASLVPALGPDIMDRSFVSGLADEMNYTLPNYRVDVALRSTHVPLGAWRGINYTQNAFYKECFIDELAHAAGADPYQYRRHLLRSSPKDLAVLDAAAEKAAWGTPLPPGRFRGIAVNYACGSYVAQVIEVSVTDGKVRVHRVVSAIDCGHVVNPLSVEMQMQGAVVYALTAALYGEITIKNGAAEQSNFNDYQMLRMADAPDVVSVIVPSGDFWGGVGEPPVPVVAPALCNAIFAATGKRIRSLPVKNHDLRAT
jgi:isoquinoline 1-oxidoreductase beta subunit